MLDFLPLQVSAEQQPQYRPKSLPVNGPVDHYNPYEDRQDDCFYQPGDLYRLMTEKQKKALISNTIEDINPVTENIKYRHAAHCYLADKDYGTRLAKGLDLNIDEVKKLAAMSEPDRLEATRTKC